MAWSGFGSSLPFLWTSEPFLWTSGERVGCSHFRPYLHTWLFGERLLQWSSLEIFPRSIWKTFPGASQAWMHPLLWPQKLPCADWLRLGFLNKPLRREIGLLVGNRATWEGCAGGGVYTWVSTWELQAEHQDCWGGSSPVCPAGCGSSWALTLVSTRATGGSGGPNNGTGSFALWEYQASGKVMQLEAACWILLLVPQQAISDRF